VQESHRSKSLVKEEMNAHPASGFDHYRRSRLAEERVGACPSRRHGLAFRLKPNPLETARAARARIAA
jgi:hypothetical protein